MKCLSLHQPWAELIRVGAKSIETRSWGTNYRGPIAIHAAKKWDRELRDLCLTHPFSRWLDPSWVDDADELKFGCIVAIADLTACRVTESIVNSLGHDERAFGDYSQGRYAWILNNIRPIYRVKLKGRQGLFNLTPSMAKSLPNRVIRDVTYFANHIPEAEPTP